MVATDTEARAWIGSLAEYNNGRLVGAWIDLDGRDEDEITEAAKAAMRPHVTMPEAQAFDEMMVFDHEGIGALVGGECSIGEAVRAAEILAGVEEYEREAFDAYVSNLGPSNIDRDSVVEAFRDCYRGEYDSLEAFATEMLDETGALDSIPEQYRAYFDYAAYGRDMRLGGDVWTVERGGSVFVFWNQ